MIKQGRSFAILLRTLGIGCIAAGSLHVVFGLGADQMIGAHVSAQSMADPGLDSQNRFYGAAFGLYGVLLLVTSSDIPRYGLIIRCVLWVFFIAGLARFVSVGMFGWPPVAIGALFALELLLPPVLLVWLRRVEITQE